MENIKGGNLAGGNPSRGRVDDDYYATPPQSTKAILDVLVLKGSILEPACGGGHMSEVLKERYPNQDIKSTDLVDRGYKEAKTGIDFLTHDYGRTFENVITNPPFKYMREFAERALEISTDKVAMFGKIQFLEGKGRKDFLIKSPLKYVYVFSERQNPMRNGSDKDENGKKWSSTMCFAWYIWEVGYEGEPMIRWL